MTSPESVLSWMQAEASCSVQTQVLSGNVSQKKEELGVDLCHTVRNMTV